MKTIKRFRLPGIATLALVAALAAGHAMMSPPAEAAADYFLWFGCPC